MSTTVDLLQWHDRLAGAMRGKRQTARSAASVRAAVMLSVSIPRQHFNYIVELVENFWFDVKTMRAVRLPSHTPDQTVDKE